MQLKWCQPKKIHALCLEMRRCIRFHFWTDTRIMALVNGIDFYISNTLFFSSFTLNLNKAIVVTFHFVHQRRCESLTCWRPNCWSCSWNQKGNILLLYFIRRPLSYLLSISFHKHVVCLFERLSQLLIKRMLLKRSLIKQDIVDQAKSLTQLRDHKMKEQSFYNYLWKPKKKKKKKNFINVSKSLAYNVRWLGTTNYLVLKLL